MSKKFLRTDRRTTQNYSSESRNKLELTQKPYHNPNLKKSGDH